jgi:superfamily I DNA/RNA helicase
VAVEGASPGAVEAHVFSGASQQATYIAHRLREAHLLGGLEWRDMAVLVRSTLGLLPSLRRALSAAGVPVAVRGAEIPLVRHAFVAQLLAVFSAALADPDQPHLTEDAAVELLCSPLGDADALALRRLRQALRRLEVSVGGRRSSGALLVEAICEPANLVTLDPDVAAPALRIAGLLTVARAAVSSRGSAEDVLWAIWSESGLAWRWQQASLEGGARGAAADRDLDAVVALFDAAARFTDRLPKAGPAVFLDHLSRQEIPGDTLAERAPSGNAVQILTAHASKGLEWELVVVAGVQEGEWPNLRMRGSLLGSELLVDLVAQRSMPGAAGAASTVSRLLDEERRLF